MLFGLGKGRNRDRHGNKEAQQGLNKAVEKKGSFARIGRIKSRAIGSRALSGSVNKLFHGVAVRARDENCCTSVVELGGQRFLSEEAPLLPLGDCSNPQGCRCVYEHFDERRDNLRRESDVGMPVRTHLQDKRAGMGRRITDG